MRQREEERKRKKLIYDIFMILCSLINFLSGDFFYMMADSAAMADQYGHKEKLCDAMSTANPSDPNSLMVTFANFTNSYWGSSFGGNCFYDTTCLTYNQSQWQPTSRAWRWQKCSEMAYFQSAPSRNSLRYYNFFFFGGFSSKSNCFAEKAISLPCLLKSFDYYDLTFYILILY